jgi:hypothetical protein
MSTHHPASRRRPLLPFFVLRHLLSITVLGSALALANTAADAAVQITIDKSNQQMTVAVDGVERYKWPVSSGVPAHETPNGTFRAFRMEEDHYSKEWDDAPMPHSIFFTKVGHAIHGTDSVRRLGSPASHGCVRLSRDNAATLYALVQKEGVLNTTVTLTGSAETAIARGRTGETVTASRRAPGEPVQIAPRTARTPQDLDNAPDVYVDQYGRPVSANRGYASEDDGRRVYQQRQPQYQRRYDEADAYGQQYYYARPAQPRSQFFYYNYNQY